MKMMINLLLGTGMAAFAEAMALGQGLGLSQKMLFDSLLGMPAVAPFLAAKRDKIEKGNYEAEFPLRWMQKDMHLASVSAYEAGVAIPLTNVTKEIYRLAMRGGQDSEDFSAVCEFTMGDTGKKPVRQPPFPLSQKREQPSVLKWHGKILRSSNGGK